MDRKDIMEMTGLIAEANRKGISIVLENGELALHMAERAKIEESLLSEIRGKKEQLSCFLGDMRYPAMDATHRRPTGPDEAMHQPKKEYLRYLITGSNVYNVLFSIEIPDVDRSILQETIKALFNRHGILNSIFENRQDRFEHVFDRPVEHNIGYVDLMDNDRPEKAIASIFTEARNIAFDFEKGPLVNIKLITYGARRSLLLFTTHHAIADNDSLQILKEEGELIYTSFKESKVPLLKEQGTSYKEYAARINAAANGETGSRTRSFYRKIIRESLLKEGIFVFPPATMGGRPRWKTYKGGLKKEIERSFRKGEPYFKDACGLVFNLTPPTGSSYTFYIDKEKKNGLNKVIARCEGSLLIVLTAILTISFYRILRRRVFRITIPISMRKTEALQRTVGWLVEDMILCIEVDEQMTFDGFVKEISRRFAEALDHPMCFHERVLDDFDLPLEIISPVLINLLRQKEVFSADMTPMHGSGSGHHCFKCSICTYINCLQFNIEYNPHVLPRDLVWAIGEEYGRILDSIIKDTHVRLCRFT